jgi:hypothetical protein
VAKRKPRKEFSGFCTFDAFNYRVHLIITQDIVASRKLRNNILGEFVYETTPYAIHCAVPDDALSYLFLPFDVGPGTIAHEAWHAVRRMLTFCCAELDNEVVAYHLGYLVSAIHEGFQKEKHGRSRRKA